MKYTRTAINMVCLTLLAVSLLGTQQYPVQVIAQLFRAHTLTNLKNKLLQKANSEIKEKWKSHPYIGMLNSHRTIQPESKKTKNIHKNKTKYHHPKHKASICSSSDTDHVCQNLALARDDIYTKNNKTISKNDTYAHLSSSRKQVGLDFINEQDKSSLFIGINESTDKAIEEKLSSVKAHLLNKEIPEKMPEKADLINEILATTKELAEQHIPYKQEDNEAHDYKRTAETQEGMAKMDCSEFVSRYLKAINVFDQVPNITTGTMVNTRAFEKRCNNMLEFMIGSEVLRKDNTFIPQSGDIFVWRRSPEESPPYGDGHTGVVLSYDAQNNVVEVMEALGKSGSADNSRNKGACVQCTRLSKYSRTGNALTSHDGWIGYYRPIYKSKT